MSQVSYVVVFPTIFAKSKIPQLVSNIKKILKARDQRFKSVRRDGDIILVDANDPVFASSAINLLFGIEKIAIAKQVKNNFSDIISEITSVGGNLLLKGERFIVRVEGVSKGFVAKDVEIAATSKIIEEKSKLGAQPGTDERFDKLLYTYLTKNNAYICIFIDKGMGGVPYVAQQDQKTICAVYDETSAICCYETVKQGYDVDVIVCYRQQSELMNLAKIINKIIPRLLQDSITIKFFHLGINPKGVKNYFVFVESILEIMLGQTQQYVSLALSPLVFPREYIRRVLDRVFQAQKTPVLALAGVDDGLFESAREMGLEKSIKKLEKQVMMTVREMPDIPTSAGAQDMDSVIKTAKEIAVRIGPNNVHDILDSLENYKI